ncbi:DUF3631 domain-containing protein [Streptomyces alkaliterrae]|uniref:DUF3631 domain-containing protein n=1 Tax=Streptomyces alkaliterrae TaxID=2213162 RepID=UPI003F69B9F3
MRRAFAAEGNPAVLRTSRILDFLNGDEEAPWSEYRTGGLSARGLQQLLKDYGINQIARKLNTGDCPHRGDSAALAHAERTLHAVSTAIRHIAEAANHAVTGQASR